MPACSVLCLPTCVSQACPYRTAPHAHVVTYIHVPYDDDLHVHMTSHLRRRDASLESTHSRWGLESLRQQGAIELVTALCCAALHTALHTAHCTALHRTALYVWVAGWLGGSLWVGQPPCAALCCVARYAVLIS